MHLFPIQYADPVEAFAPWAETPWAMLLDSAALHPQRGRYAYIAVDPHRTLTCRGETLLCDGVPTNGDPFFVLEQMLQQDAARFLPDQTKKPTPFAGGAVGVFGYELGGRLERAPRKHRLPAPLPDLAVGLYDVVAAFDLAKRQAWVISPGPDSRAKAAALADRLRAADQPRRPTHRPPLTWRAEMSRQNYLENVRHILDNIRAGDVYQVNLTQRFTAELPPNYPAFEAYRALRRANPSPFAAFMRCGPDMTLLSASPERFFSVTPDGRIETRPIKGSRPRGATIETDAAAARELASSQKDFAENLMITDLLRNDISRVASIGSVSVPALAQLESFAKMHHLVSVIEGRLRPGLSPVSLLRAGFPGGSVTGAPKIRAMEIIDALETGPRGPYCGAAAWIGYDGAMDSSIIIRSATLTQNEALVQAGGGVVADSTPEAEYEEMMAKARPTLETLSHEDLA